MAWVGAFSRRVLSNVKEPGVAVLIVRGDRVELADGYGLRDLATHARVTADTAFMLGSNTKLMTAVAVGLLKDAGRLDFDSKAHAVLPDFVMSAQANTDAVTIADILSHRTGLPPHDLAWYGADKLSREDLVVRLRYLAVDAAPRSRWQYNNLMYAVAGRIVEVASHETWEAFVTEHILKPLKMDGAALTTEAFVAQANHATPYVRQYKRLVSIAPQRLGAMAPAGGLAASMTEMAPWVKMLLAEGRTDHGRLIDAATLTSIETPLALRGEPVVEPGATPAAYAMGLNVDEYRGHRRLNLTGSIDGYHARLVLFPADGLGVLVAANTEGSRIPEIISNTISDRLLRLQATDWEAVFKPAALRHAAAKPPLALDAERSGLLGHYENPGYGVLGVIRTGSNAIALELNGRRADLSPDGPGRFLATATDDPQPSLLPGSRLFVERDGLGRVTRILASFEPAVGPIVFEPVRP